MIRRITTGAAVALTLAIGAGNGATQIAPPNLLTNAGFENGLTDWTASNVTVGTYGASGLPTALVSTTIGGGGVLAIHNGSNSFGQLVQSVEIPDTSPASVLRVGGYLGSYRFPVFGSTDESPFTRTRVSIQFFAGLNPLGPITALDVVRTDSCNKELVLIRREGFFEIPAEATRFEFVVDFLPLFCGVCDSVTMADGLFAHLIDGSPLPAPLPADTELLINGDFESGYGNLSPLPLTAAQGWEGWDWDGPADSGYRTRAYFDTSLQIAEQVPDALSGGASLLSVWSSSSQNHTLRLRQRLDVRGNRDSQQFTSETGLAIRVSADLGGAGPLDEPTRVRIRMLNDSPDPLPVAPDVLLGPVSRDTRNRENVMMRRVAEIPVPAQTAFIDVLIEAQEYCCQTGGWPLIDNVSARLVAPAQAPLQPMNQNLITNASFENGSVPDSPLTLEDPAGWYGVSQSPSSGARLVRVLEYVSEPELPQELAAIAVKKMLGSQLLRGEAANSELIQTIDLSAHSGTIDAGALVVHAAAWLGGISTSNDTATLRLNFKREDGIGVGQAMLLGPITAEDRSFVTSLLKVNGKIDAPALARSLDVAVVFQSGSGFGQQHALADGISVSLAQKSVATCDAIRLKAAGKLLRRALGAHAKELVSSKFDVGDLSKALQKFATKFDKAFATSASKADSKGATCSAPAPAALFSSLILDSTETTVDEVNIGIDEENAADQKLRAKLMKLLGRYGQKLFNADAKNVKSPDATKLSAAKQKALVAFLKGAAKAMKKAGPAAPLYEGLSAEELALLADSVEIVLVTQLQ